MARQRDVITTRSEPVGVLAVLVATLLGAAGVGFWINLGGIWVDWQEPFAAAGRQWHAFALPRLEPVFGWLPPLLNAFFHTQWPAWGYDYIAASIFFEIGLAIAMGPDLIKSLTPHSDVDDDDQDRIIGGFVGRDIGQKSRRSRLPTMATLRAFPALALKGLAYAVAAVITCAFIWPFFLISVPFAFLSLITKRRVSHFVRMTYVLFAPAMFATLAWLANVILTTQQ